MITLDTLSNQLNDQLFDASFAAVPADTRTEGIRQALGQINAQFAASYTVSGLDGAVATTLPDGFVSALLLGASAFIVDFAIRSRLVGYHDSPTVSDQLVPWAKSLKEEFEVALERLRMVDLQQSTNQIAFQAPIDNNIYNLSLDI